jgi:hypothetical protein
VVGETDLLCDRASIETGIEGCSTGLRCRRWTSANLCRRRRARRNTQRREHERADNKPKRLLDQHADPHVGPTRGAR